MSYKEMLAKISAKIAAKRVEIDALMAKAEKTKEDVASVKAMTKEFNDLHDEYEAVLEMQKAAGRNALPANEDAVAATAKKKLTSTEKIGIAIGALLQRHAEPGKSALQYMDEMGHGDVAKEFETHKKTLMASSAINGGLLVPTDMANDIIEILRPETAYLQLDPIRIPMPNGNYKLPGGATGANASYQQEGDPASVTGMTFRDVELTARTLTSIIPVTNDLLNFSISGAMSFVQNDLRRAMAQTMDSMLMRGDGTKGNPTGITKIAGVTSLQDTNTNTPTYTEIDVYARSLINVLVSNYIPFRQVYWVIGKLLIGYLADLRSTTGVPIYPGLQAVDNGQKMMWKGFPVLPTTNIPVNLNTRNSGHLETEMYLVAGDQVIFGESTPLELAVSSEAAVEIGGQVLSMFQRRMTAVLAVQQHDTNVRHLGAVAVGTGITWGAA